jgi:hypothetical protein
VGPQGLTGNKPWRWTPDYRTTKGESYTVDGVESAECPVSAITSESLAWLEEHGAAAWLRDAGAAAYGADLASWPGRALDAHKLIQIEQARLDAARDDATR